MIEYFFYSFNIVFKDTCGIFTLRYFMTHSFDLFDYDLSYKLRSIFKQKVVATNFDLRYVTS